MNKIKHNFIIGIVSESLWGMSIGFFMPQTTINNALVDLGGSPALAGFLASLFGFGLSLPQFFSALLFPPKFTDPPRMVLLHSSAILGPLVAALGLWFLPSEPSSFRLWTLLAGFAVFSFGIGVVIPHWAGCIGRCLPEKIRGRYFGLCFFASGLCAAGTGWLGSHWAAQGGLQWGYALCFSLAPVLMVASVLTMLLFRPLRPAARPFVKDVVRDGLRILKEKVRHPGSFRLALVLVFLLNAASAPGNLFTIYLRSRGVETAWFEAFTPALAIGGMAGALGLGWLVDQKGFRMAYMAAFTVGALSLAAIFLPGHFAGPVSAFAGFGFMTSAFPVVNLALILRIAGHAESTLQQGLFSTLLSPWSLLAPLAAGWLAEWAGYPWAFGSGIFFTLAAFAVLALVPKLDGKTSSKKRKA